MMRYCAVCKGVVSVEKIKETDGVVYFYDRRGHWVDTMSRERYERLKSPV